MPESDDATIDPTSGRLTVGHLTPWPGVETVAIPGGFGFRPAEGPAAVLQREPHPELRIVAADGTVLVTLSGTTTIQIHDHERLAEAGDRFRAALLSATRQVEPEPRRSPLPLPLLTGVVDGRRQYWAGPGPYFSAGADGRPHPVPPGDLELVDFHD